ncbi:MAG: alpha/beta hydrolase [Halobacteriota archaeon]|nr:alpha/beta hydrolase [Halobacteriota archaeon]
MFHEKFLKVVDTNISYISEGGGEVILFIHGLSGCKEEWEFSIPFFADNFNAVAIDLPGSGHSDKPDADYTMDFYCDAIKGFLDAMGIEKTVLVGNSMGGLIVQFFTLKYPENVNKLILVDAATINSSEVRSPFTLNSEAIQEQKGFSPSMIKMMKRMLFYKPSEATDKLIERAISDIKREDHPAAFKAILSSAANLINADLGERVGDISPPTLIVWGENDRLMCPKVARGLCEKISGSELVIIDECGHVPMLERPDEFNKAVLDFIN